MFGDREEAHGRLCKGVHHRGREPVGVDRGNHRQRGVPEGIALPEQLSSRTCGSIGPVAVLVLREARTGSQQCLPRTRSELGQGSHTPIS